MKPCRPQGDNKGARGGLRERQKPHVKETNERAPQETGHQQLVRLKRATTRCINVFIELCSECAIESGSGYSSTPDYCGTMAAGADGGLIYLNNDPNSLHTGDKVKVTW